jgi:hypothetical protein
MPMKFKIFAIAAALAAGTSSAAISRDGISTRDEFSGTPACRAGWIWNNNGFCQRVATPWPDVDCATAKLTTTASQPRCQVGPAVSGYAAITSTGGQEDCAIEQWTVATRSPSNFGYALLANIRNLAPHCQVYYKEGIAAAMKYNGSVAQNGTGWSAVNQIGGIYTASFTSAGGQTASVTSVGGENCKAFLKLGPPNGGGFLWVVRGWLCGVQGQSVSDRDLHAFADSLIVKAP